MGARPIGMLLATVAVAGTAHAVGPRSTTRILADELTAMPAAGIGKPLRAQREVRFGKVTPAWQRFAATGTWQASWDPATGVPSRIWGSGIAAPGTNASPAEAERVARQVLADHLALLAPGAAISDFVVVANHSDGELRSVGFEQRARGRRVVGGQVSFRFKRDRLFVIGSEALPHVAVREPRARLARSVLHARASAALRRELELPHAPVGGLGDEVVLPLVARDAVLGYRIATPVTIDGGAGGKYLAYVDPENAAVIAVHQQNEYATGTLLYRGVDRHPGRGRLDRPAGRAHVMVGPEAQTTTADGELTWTPEAAQTVTTAVVGDLVELVNRGTGGALATAQLPLAPGGQAVWDASGNSEQDAQLVVFLATNTVKAYVRANLDPMMPRLDEPITANVNIAQSCNAFFDGTTINFFHATTACQNTGLIEDVVYHEFGHALHRAEIIDGVGAHDRAMSEGASDFLAASITGDPGMGRGLFYDDSPLRHLDPPGAEARWPQDLGVSHQTGMIYGGAFWDLRTALIAAMGETAGIAHVNQLYLATLRRAVSIPSSLVEVLAADDDDGDLANGTPNECAIRDAFGRHGLRTVTGTVTAPGAIRGDARETIVRVDLAGVTACASDAIDRVTLIWVPSHTGIPAAGTVIMTAGDPQTYWAQLPLPLDSVLYYSARIHFADGTILTLADNLADPFYTLYQGETVPLYCTSLDEDPFADGWTTGTADGGPSPWQWGTPAGGATDPPAAYAGTHVLAQALGGDYPAMTTSWVALPPIDAGTWSDVRLQYRRWLAVEDREFDEAKVTVNDQQAWINHTQDRGDSSMFHHVDREWRFHDVALSGYGHGHTLDVRISLASDAGFQLGGWAIDELCVVANVHSVCGDGVKSATEQCDDGPENANEPGRCRTYCKAPSCGDGVVDEAEACDDGPGSEHCSATCVDLTTPPPEETGCCSSGGGGPVALPLGGFVVVALARRRRRRARRS